MLEESRELFHPGGGAMEYLVSAAGVGPRDGDDDEGLRPLLDLSARGRASLRFGDADGGSVVAGCAGAHLAEVSGGGGSGCPLCFPVAGFLLVLPLLLHPLRVLLKIMGSFQCWGQILENRLAM